MLNTYGMVVFRLQVGDSITFRGWQGAVIDGVYKSSGLRGNKRNIGHGACKQKNHVWNISSATQWQEVSILFFRCIGELPVLFVVKLKKNTVCVCVTPCHSFTEALSRFYWMLSRNLKQCIHAWIVAKIFLEFRREIWVLAQKIILERKIIA